MISAQENINMQKYSTFFVGGVCKYFIEINKEEDIVEAFNFINLKKENREIDYYFILGEGSNAIFSDDLSKLCILKINIKSQNNNFKIIKEEIQENIFVEALAGDSWDDLVLFCCNNNLYGLENLSYVPGSVGAAPVQNIGAYGVEVKDCIASVKVYNIEKNIFEILENNTEEGKNFLDFKYRDSIFKKNKNKYIIISVTFILNKKRNINNKYEGLNILESDNAMSIREKVINIRKNKLPEWKVIPNSGSFFKNPIVNKDKLQEVLNVDKNLKYFDFENEYKLSAAYLIDSLNLKGYNIGGAKVSTNHALILIN